MEGTTACNVGGMLPLELYGRRARRTEVAQNKEDATLQGVADQERLLTGQVRTRFGEALASIRNLMFAEQLLQVNRDFLKLMEARVREGATPPLDADETRVEVNRIETMRIDYQAKAEVALLALKETVGIDPEESIRLKGRLNSFLTTTTRSNSYSWRSGIGPTWHFSGRTRLSLTQTFV